MGRKGGTAPQGAAPFPASRPARKGCALMLMSPWTALNGGTVEMGSSMKIDSICGSIQMFRNLNFLSPKDLLLLVCENK